MSFRSSLNWLENSPAGFTMYTEYLHVRIKGQAMTTKEKGDIRRKT